jgi:hypothetical protein
MAPEEREDMSHRWILALALLGAAPAAKASILGDEGVEIESVHDRRGFFVRPGIAFGAGLPEGRTVPVGRLTLGLGAGLTKDTLIGVEGGPAGIFGENGAAGAYVDLEVSQFFGSGTFVRLGLGIAPVPTTVVTRAGAIVTRRDDVAVGFGGRLGLGQEVWTGASQAFGIGVFYDGRIDPDQKLVSGVIAAAYLVFY